MKKIEIFHGLSNSCMVAAQYSCIEQLNNWKNKKSTIDNKNNNDFYIHDEQYSTSESMYLNDICMRVYSYTIFMSYD